MSEDNSKSHEFRIKPDVSGPGLESIVVGRPVILATTHFADTDPQYAIFGLYDRIGGLKNIDIPQSSTHETSQRPAHKVGTQIAKWLSRRFLARDILHSISHELRTTRSQGKSTTSETGRAIPSDWKPLVNSLQANRIVVTAGYYDYTKYFELPKKSGYLPLILKHSVPEAPLLPVATIYKDTVYQRRIHVPIDRPRIIVGAPVDLPPLTWLSEDSQEVIARTLPDATDTPIGFLKSYMELRGQTDTGAIPSEAVGRLNEETRHIIGQLRDQSVLLMSEFRKIVPENLTSQPQG